MYIWNHRKLTKGNPSKEEKTAFQYGKKLGITTAFWTTALQLVFGTLLLISLKKEVMLLYMGENLLLTSILLGSIIVTFLLIFFLFMVMRTDAKRWIHLSISSFILVIALMGWMRHEVREAYIEPYEQLSPRTVQHEIVDYAIKE